MCYTDIVRVCVELTAGFAGNLFSIEPQLKFVIFNGVLRIPED